MINPTAKRVTVLVQSMADDDLMFFSVYGDTPAAVRREAILAYAESVNAGISENFRFDDANELFTQSALFRGITAGQPVTAWDCDGLDLETLDFSGDVTVFVDTAYRDPCDPYCTILNVETAAGIPAALVPEYAAHTGDDLGVLNDDYRIVGVMAGTGLLHWCAWSADFTDERISEVLMASPSYADLTA